MGLLLLVITHRLHQLESLQRQRLKVEQAILDGDTLESWKDLVGNFLLIDDKIDELKEGIRKMNEAMAESGKDTAKTTGRVQGKGPATPTADFNVAD